MEYSIEVNGISKQYRLYDNNRQRLREALSFGKTNQYSREFYALNDVSFSVAKGDIVGIIGTNGAGKSTLLKIISGVLQPTSGTVSVNGRVSALLELGAGFNMEYTGIENIKLNGLMIGLTQNEIESRIPQILQFAEIGDFVYQPVKTYSSGMFARLAFAVSINVSPDVLIIDEALSVGDMYFQEKCYEKMKQMVKSGATILFVSHSLPAVRNFCRKAIWLDNGRIVSEGPAHEVCNEYKSYTESKFKEEKTVSKVPKVAIEKEKNKLIIENVSINKKCFYMGENIVISILIKYKAEQMPFGVGVIIRNSKGEIVTLFNTIRDDIIITDRVLKVDLTLINNGFTEGEYSVSVNFCDDQIMYPLDREDDICSFCVMAINNKNGVPISEGQFRQEHSWDFSK